jgi:hypothetical protein
MLKRLLKWEVNEVDRRTFLQRTLVATFALFASASIGKVNVAEASCSNPCLGPYGYGQCSSDLCYPPPNAWECGSNSYGTSCWWWTGAHNPHACWTSYVNGCSGTCCDCQCNRYGTYNFYCYCHG